MDCGVVLVPPSARALPVNNLTSAAPTPCSCSAKMFFLVASDHLRSALQMAQNTSCRSTRRSKKKCVLRSHGLTNENVAISPWALGLRACRPNGSYTLASVSHAKSKYNKISTRRALQALETRSSCCKTCETTHTRDMTQIPSHSLHRKLSRTQAHLHLECANRNPVDFITPRFSARQRRSCAWPAASRGWPPPRCRRPRAAAAPAF